MYGAIFVSPALSDDYLVQRISVILSQSSHDPHIPSPIFSNNVVTEAALKMVYDRVPEPAVSATLPRYYE